MSGAKRWKFFVVPLHCFGYKSTNSRSRERFRGGQYNLVTCFFVLILLVPWPVICKRGARAPCHIWSRRHFPWDGGTVSHYNSHSIWMHSVTRTTCIFPVFALKVMHAVILLTRFCKLLTRVALMSGGHVPQVPQCHNASALTPQKVERA